LVYGRFPLGGGVTEGEAIALMHKAFNLGITLFDAADTYGNGLSEELIAKAFPTSAMRSQSLPRSATTLSITVRRAGAGSGKFCPGAKP
jgi:predicted oxidoreductase